MVLENGAQEPRCYLYIREVGYTIKGAIMCESILGNMLYKAKNTKPMNMERK